MIEYYCAVIGILHLQSGNKSFYSSRLSRNIWPKSGDFYIVQKMSYLWEILFFWEFVQTINLISSGIPTASAFSFVAVAVVVGWCVSFTVGSLNDLFIYSVDTESS